MVKQIWALRNENGELQIREITNPDQLGGDLLAVSQYDPESIDTQTEYTIYLEGDNGKSIKVPVSGRGELAHQLFVRWAKEHLIPRSA